MGCSEVEAMRSEKVSGEEDAEVEVQRPLLGWGDKITVMSQERWTCSGPESGSEER